MSWILEKAEEQEIKLPISAGSYKKQGNSRIISTSASLTTLKPLTVWITTNCGKFFKRWEYQTTLSASWETCIQVKKQQLEPDMEQKDKYRMGPLIWGTQKRQIHRDGKKRRGYWGPGRRVVSYYLVDSEFLFDLIEKFWQWIEVVVVRHCKCT